LDPYRLSLLHDRRDAAATAMDCDGLDRVMETASRMVMGTDDAPCDVVGMQNGSASEMGIGTGCDDGDAVECVKGSGIRMDCGGNAGWVVRGMGSEIRMESEYGSGSESCTTSRKMCFQSRIRVPGEQAVRAVGWL
jgi:hypothetical protein